MRKLLAFLYNSATHERLTKRWFYWWILVSINSAIPLMLSIDEYHFFWLFLWIITWFIISISYSFKILKRGPCFWRALHYAYIIKTLCCIAFPLHVWLSIMVWAISTWVVSLLSSWNWFFETYITVLIHWSIINTLILCIWLLICPLLRDEKSSM